MRQSILKNLGVLALSLLLCLIVIEVVGQRLMGDPISQRTLLYSENPWVFDERGFVRYQPGAVIRTAAIYGDVIEYDESFSTNAAGFIDDQEYPPVAVHDGHRNIAIVGDSFTAGVHGARPWVPTLREAPGFDPERHRIFNFGVAGTGLQSFRNLLAAYREPLRIGEILVVAIASDFDRTLWRPVVQQDKIILCHLGSSTEACRNSKSRIFRFPRAATSEELMTLARSKQLEMEGSPWALIKARSYVIHLARLVKYRFRAASQPASELTLGKIRADFPDATIRLLHIP